MFVPPPPPPPPPRLYKGTLSSKIDGFSRTCPCQKLKKKMCKGLLHMWCVTFLMVSFFRFQNMQALRRIPRFWLSLSIGFLMLSKDLDSSISLWFSYFLTCNELLVLTRKKQQLSTLHVKTLHNYRSQERAYVSVLVMSFVKLWFYWLAMS